MHQTSKRSQKRQIARKRTDVVAQPQYNETHPLGNRTTRRHQAKINRTAMMTSRKEGFQRHLRNLREAVVAGYKMRMEAIAKRKLAGNK